MKNVGITSFSRFICRYMLVYRQSSIFVKPYLLLVSVYLIGAEREQSRFLPEAMRGFFRNVLQNPTVEMETILGSLHHPVKQPKMTCMSYSIHYTVFLATVKLSQLNCQISLERQGWKMETTDFK